jgi:DNA-binding MarR family transcriptional regulator
MNLKTIEDQLRELEKKQDKNWQRIIFQFRKHLDIWSHHHIKSPWGQIKLSYWPVICNIAVDGSTVAEISKKSMVTKQNISRTIKELEEHGIIYSTQNKHDKRSEVLCLSDEGKKFVLYANGEVVNMNKIYMDLVGEKDLEITLRVINKLMVYHESENNNYDMSDMD